MSLERIFINIASYRDSQLETTIRSAISRADHPERLVFGVLNQVNLTEDADCIIQDLTDLPQVKQVVVDYNTSQGACWSRSYIWTELLQDEEFALQTDSHMRFSEGWDTRLINMWYQLQDDKGVLTHYPMPFNAETEEVNPQKYTRFDVQAFRESGMPNVTSAALAFEDGPKQPALTAFIAAGFLFGRGQMFKDVPYDPYIYFHGEEMTYAARLWTNGYNLYLPTEGFTWHDYHNNNRRPLHWKDHPEEYQAKDKLAIQRIRHLMGVEKAKDPAAIENLAHYGLGFVRTLTEYEIFSGVSYRYQELDERVKTGIVEPNYQIRKRTVWSN